MLDSLSLEEIACSLRPERSIVNSHLQHDIENLPRGLTNIHVPMVFDDGIKWIARTRQVGIDAVPREIGRVIMQGEMDTMEWLRNAGSCPVARVISPIYSESCSHLHPD